MITLKNGMNFSIIIDGMEQKIYSCSDKQISKASYSGKKSAHTFTKLIGVSREGNILFLSPSYIGSLSDSNLVNFPENWIYKYLEIHENIMGDLGFRGLEYLKIYTMKSEVFKGYDIEHDFKHFRVIVENVIGHIRKWKICKQEFQSKLKTLDKAREYHHFIFEIVAGLVNLFVCPLRNYDGE
jgi:hypothetical protein